MEKTIAAVSTGAAPGGIGVVRVSGPQARAVADRVFRGISGKPVAEMAGYTAQLGWAVDADGQRLDQVIALCFAAPKSYTGEDVVELSCHGGLYLTRRILQAVLDAGASPAGPGEFTRRAFLNGKLDLTRAEAVMQLVRAEGEQAARTAAAGSDGVLAGRIAALREELGGLAAHLAAWTDFPDEEVPFVSGEELAQGLASAEQALSGLLDSFARGRACREGVETAIVGETNVGKSTLMNLLAGRTRSIVTDIPGTTRDVVEDTVLVGGVPLRLADTAGLRETGDPVERIGVAAARARLESAQLVLAVFDASRPRPDGAWLRALDPARTVAVVNKADLPGEWPAAELQSDFPYTVSLSAKTGEGLEALESAIGQLLGTAAFQPAGALYTERQRDEVKTALAAVREGQAALAAGMTMDAVNVCVEDALSALYALTGERASEEIVDRVFAEFCVGK